MSKNRDRQRTNKRKYKPEEYLDRNNEFGFRDETPRLALKEIINKEREVKK